MTTLRLALVLLFCALGTSARAQTDLPYDAIVDGDITVAPGPGTYFVPGGSQGTTVTATVVVDTLDCDNLYDVYVAVIARGVVDGLPASIYLGGAAVYAADQFCDDNEGEIIDIPIVWDQVPGLADFALEVLSHGDDWTIELALDGVFDPDETNDVDVIGSYPAPHVPLPLSGYVTFGDAMSPLRFPFSAATFADHLDCRDAFGANAFAWTSGDIAVTFGGWTPTTTTMNGLACVGPGQRGSTGVDLTVLAGETQGFTTSGVIGGLPVSLDAKLEAFDGIVSQLTPFELALTLPSGTSAHANDLGRPRPRGQRLLYFDTFAGGPISHPGAAVGTEPELDFWITSDRLPFSVRFAAPTFGATGLAGNATTTARWHFDQAYAALDDKHLDRVGPRANGVRYKSLSASVMRVDASGLDATLTAASGSGQAHFPRGKIGWLGSTLSVVDGVLQEATLPIDVNTRLELQVASRCPGCSTNDGSPNALDVGFHNPYQVRADGTVIATVNNVPPPSWGSVRSANGFTFSMSGLNGLATLVMPGHEFAVGTTPAKELLGSVHFDGTSWQRRPIDHPEVQKGNGFFAGLTIGPETYRTSQGQPVQGLGYMLDQASVQVALGGPGAAYAALGLSAGAKIVQRHSGVTGVFNVDDFPSSLNIYGFPFQLRRFAFRQVMNRMDTTSWIDGGVGVPEPADFAIRFSSLALTCGGHLAGGSIDAAAGGTQRLKAWNAPFTIASLTFEPKTNEPACGAAERTLAAGGGVYVASFAKAIQLDSRWLPTGLSEKAIIKGDGAVELDRETVGCGGTNPGGTEQDPCDGYTTQLRDAKLEYRATDCTDGDPCGWFSFGATLSVPFWNAIPARVRVANAGPLTQASGQWVRPAATPTLVVDEGFPARYAAAWAGTRAGAVTAYEGAGNNAEETNLAAVYKWAFPITLPLRWNSPSNTFIAHPLIPVEEDLAVLKLKAAADFVTPHATKVSFGASADLEKLAAPTIALRVDLNDKKSVAQIDTFLAGLPFVDNDAKPVAAVVTAIQNPAKILLDQLGGGFDDFVKTQIRTTLTTLLEPATKAVASGLAAAQSVPQYIASGLLEPVKAGIDSAVSAIAGELGAGPDALALEVYGSLEDTWLGLAQALYAADDASDFANQLDLAKTVLLKLGKDAESGVAGLLYKVKGGLDQAHTTLSNIRTTVTQLADDAAAKLVDVDAKLGALIDFFDASSESGQQYLSCDDTKNPILKQLNTVRDAVASFQQALSGQTLDGLADLIGKPLGVDLVPIKAASKEIGDKVKALASKVIGTGSGGVIGQAKALFCEGAGSGTAGNVTGRLQQLALKAKDFLVSVRAPIKTLAENDPGTGKAKIHGLVVKLNELVVDPLGKLRSMRDKVGAAAGKVAEIGGKLQRLIDYAVAYDFNGVQIPADVDPALIDVTGLLDGVALDILEAVQADVPPGWQGWTNNGSNPSASFVVLLVDSIRRPLNQFLGTVQAQIGNQIAALVSSLPFPKAEALRDQLIGFIMSSPFIEQLDKLVNDATSTVMREMNSLGVALLQQVNELIKKALLKFNEQATRLLAGATSELKGMLGFSAAKLDGYAIIGKTDLERLHVEAAFTMNKSDSGGGNDEEKKKKETTFGAALDVVSWKVNGKAKNCLPPTDPNVNAEYTTPIDASITASNLPILLGPGDMTIKTLKLGFTLDPSGPFPVPIGVAGFIETQGKLDFQAFTLRDIRFAVGAGTQETYLGAAAAASFQGVDVSVAFLVGRMCNGDVLKQLDPAIGSFIEVPEGKFEGGYIRGSAAIPIIAGGCFLTFGATADVGAWVFLGDTTTIGGLVGGGLYGEGICLIGIAGRLRLAGQVAAGDFSFRGSGWIGGGIGFCEPEEWQTPDDVANDGWCLTATAAVQATYQGGSFDVGSPSFSGLD